jgi:NhaP-type Na+/H+ or K+/H+ antiporter
MASNGPPRVATFRESPMSIAGVFAALLLGYALISRSLGAWSISPQIVAVAVGILVGIVTTDAVLPHLTIEGLRLIGEVALVLCLFTDAARIDLRSIRGSANIPARLLLIGLPLTIVFGVVVGLVVLPAIGLVTAFLVAVLLAPTDAGLGQAVVSDRSVPVRIRQAINVESGLNDGLVTPLVLFAVAIGGFEITGAETETEWIRFAISEIGWGILAGLVIGTVGAWLLRRAVRSGQLSPSFRWVIAPSFAILAWAVTPSLGGNAFIAAFVGGLATTAVAGRLPDAFTEFGETAGELAGLAVFFLFGTLLPSIGGFSIPVLVYAVLSLTVVRMVPVALSLVGTDLSWASVGFIGWFGPRGLASIVLALLALGDGRVPVLAPGVVAVVAMTVLLSILAHGLSAGVLVRRYARATARLDPTAPELVDAPDLAARRLAGVVAPGEALSRT